MSDFTLNAHLRSDTGKGASRRLRREANLIPAIIYGAGKEPTNISLENREVVKLLLNDAAFSSILTINVGGTKEDVLIKDLQRHPYKEFVQHADFIRVLADQKLTTLVPVTLINEENCVGVKLGGGEIFRPSPEVEISCLPKDLPDSIEVDVTNLEVGQFIHIEDITPPAGVELLGSNIAVVTVQAARVEEEDEAVEAVEEESTEEKTEE